MTSLFRVALCAILASSLSAFSDMDPGAETKGANMALTVAGNSACVMTPQDKEEL